MAMVAPASARFTHNESNSGFEINANWDDGMGTHGDTYMNQTDARASMAFNAEIVEPIMCGEDESQTSVYINGGSDNRDYIDLAVSPTKGKNNLTSALGTATL